MSVSTSGPERYPRSGQTTERRLELWMRPGTHDDEVEHLVAQAHALESAGEVAAVNVREWDGHQDLSSRLHSHRDREARTALHTFKRWAWRHGSRLPGFGERRRAGRGRMGPEYITQRVPPVLLAEYEEGVLVNVTPCDRSSRCVSERLAVLETGTESTAHSRLVR